jgi:Ran GTPase-activating protein (RanGAP) involved in mRNA processing and transport
MTKITLTAGGPRTRVEVAEAQEILKRFQKTRKQHEESQVHTLNLSCRQWPLESLQVLKPLLTEIASQVIILKIDDIIAGLPTDDGLASLGFLAELFAGSDIKIQEMDLSDNALGTRGVKVLKPVLQCQSLSRLYLHNCGLSAEVSQTLLDMLQPNAAHLTALGLGRNQMGPAGAAAVSKLLAACINLESFYYAGTRPLAEGTGHICQGLAAMTKAIAASHQTSQLQILDLDDCTFRSGDDVSDPCVALIECLEASPKLTKLILRDGELQVAGLQRVLAALLKAGVRLQVLDLGAIGEMGVDGAAAVNSYFSSNAAVARQLQEFAFDTNELTDEGLADLMAPFTATECQLQKLNLAENELTGAGIRVLLDNPVKSLKEINLADNPDIPLQLANKLQAMYTTVLVEEDLEEGEDEEEEDADVDAIADQLAGAHLK